METRTGEVREWVEEVLRGLRERERILYMVGCWALWERRNKRVFEGVGWCMREVVRRVQDLVCEMQEVVDEREKEGPKQSTGSSINEERRWQKPKEGEWKVNVDASVKEGVGTGWEAVCRDNTWRIAWGVARQVEEELDPPLAEALAVLWGMQEAKQAGMRSIIVEGDCSTVMEDIKLRKQGRSDIFSIYKDIFELCNWFETISFVFTRRIYNRLVHELARATPWTIGRRCWSDSIPNDFLCIAESDAI
ncbi:uncharacterized protein LOC141637294 [Silene latifolia]|uniref:uncharacterized protein LOC141637294 n=1 Tax=Silene latifolia TaxID=37657 RepID=UPI003D770545